MSRQARNPSNWDEYQYGTSHRSSVSSTGSGGRSVRFEERERDVSPGGSAQQDLPDSETTGLIGLRRRRSSVAMRLSALSQVGGVNSIENFARSWQRAAGFHEVTPIRPSFLLATDEAINQGEPTYDRTDVEHGPHMGPSLLRQHLEASSGSPENAVEDEVEDEAETPRPMDHDESNKYRLGSDLPSIQGSMRGSQSIFAIAPHLATPLAGSYGTSYGTLRSTLNESSMIQAGQLWRQQQETGASQPDGERAPLIVKEVEQDGHVILAVDGQSTLPQTAFNSTNVLIGVGLLTLPMGIKYAGWLFGMIFLAISTIVTSYTAMLLARCMDADASLITFADLAFISYGSKARVVTSILFSLELLAACVALIVLFADTLDLLIPGVGIVEWKLLCGLILIPLNFVPLKFLSFSSILGILSCFSIVLIVFVDGFVKPDAPGSLRDPAQTYLFPANWLTLPLSFGLLMSPLGGHSVFPSIYRDMRHPHKYGKAVKMSFSFTYVLNTATAAAGHLMFGDDVMDEISSNILAAAGYPRALTILMSIFIAIIPLTKLPLNARPIVSTVELFSGLNAQYLASSSDLVGLSAWSRGLLKIVVRVVVIIIFVITAIIFPAFDAIMALMGSLLCSTVCVILPCMFYLKLYGKEIPRWERWLNYFLITVFSIFAVIGTVFACLPKTMIGAE